MFDAVNLKIYSSSFPIIIDVSMPCRGISCYFENYFEIFSVIQGLEHSLLCSVLASSADLEEFKSITIHL